MENHRLTATVLTGQTAASDAGARAERREGAFKPADNNRGAAPDATSPDGEPAEWKMTDDRRRELQVTILASAPESECSVRKPGARSRHAPSSPGLLAVEPGRNFGEQLVPEGCSGAVRETRPRAGRAPTGLGK